MNQDQAIRPLLWIASAKEDLKDMPPEVRLEFGHGLFEAQIGAFPSIAKVLNGFGGAHVLELKMKHQGDAFRAVYTVRFKEIVIVLHAFQKKSKSGIKTPKTDIDLIHSRLKLAEVVYQEWKSKRGNNG